MGFKRTSEGRVFFKGSGQSGSYPSAHDETAPIPSSSAQTQMQILVLLRGLNEKLKVTKNDRTKMQEELAAYRALIEELEAKAERSERAYQAVEQKIASRENLVEETLKELEATRKHMAALESQTKSAYSDVNNLKSQIGQNQKISQAVAKKQIEIETKLAAAQDWQSAFTDRLENALNEQNKLARKLDKTIEDRVRFMRKIERIEETVIQTRDSLNAKAMVLLTDQNKGQGAEPGAKTEAQISREEAQYTPAYAAQEATKPAWWNHSSRAQMVAIGFFIIGGILTGWLISELQKPIVPAYPQADITAAAPPANAQQTVQPPASAAPEWQTSEDTAPFSAAPLPADSLRFIEEGRVPTVEEDQANLRLLEQNPDELAAALNALEPSTPIKAAPQAAPAPISADENAPDISEQEPFQQASLTEGEPVVELPPATAPPAPPVSQAPPPAASKADPRQMISPDSALPPAVAQIESEAFAGSPEAQHDLAAIYTAGHAGVAQDYERAAFWFTRAAEGGIPNARYNLGVLYHQGLGVKSDLSKAIYWYQEAARVGHAEAQYNLGIAHIEGIGVSYDPEEAARNFESAARLGVVEAAYNLGLIYENGLLGQSKPDEAMMWYKHAADKGSPEAKAALDQLARSIGVAPQDVGKIAGQVSTMNAAHASIPNANPDDNQVLVAQIQEYLMRSGLYPGPADGINGPLTRDAVRSYQALNDIRVDGVITQELLSHMLANTQNYRNVLVDDGVGSRAQ